MGTLSRFAYAIVLLLAGMPIVHGAPFNNPDYPAFEKIFNQWTDAFNHKDLKTACSLFAKNIIADTQSMPRKDYDTICTGFQTVFNSTKSYQYHFTLHDVYRTGDLAAARITWYLKVTEGDKLVSATQEEGMDVLKQDKDGKWKVINFIAYPTIKE